METIFKSKTEMCQYIYKRHNELAGTFKKVTVINKIAEEILVQPYYKVKSRQIYKILSSKHISVK